MAHDARVTQRRDGGFSPIELLVVVCIIAVMAAVSFPAISRYIRNYRIKGAAVDVAGEIQTTRSKAIMSNTNAGVSFVAVDADKDNGIESRSLSVDSLSEVFQIDPDTLHARFLANAPALAAAAGKSPLGCGSLFRTKSMLWPSARARVISAPD